MILDYLECKIGHRRSATNIVQSFSESPSKRPFSQGSYSKKEQNKIPVQKDKDEAWLKVKKYYKVDFKEGENLKRPLVDSNKRKMLSTLLKNDHLTVKSVHNNMMERIVYQK